MFKYNVQIIKSTTFVILSQPDSYHVKLASDCKLRLTKALKDSKIDAKAIVTTENELKYHGSWTIFPVLTQLANKLKLVSKWVVFLDPQSSVNIDALAILLAKHYNKHFIGHGLEDREHTIIHHFKDPKSLLYPNFEAGFILSGSLINDISSSIALHGNGLDWLPKDFSIDAQYELALALKERNDRHVLIHEPLICIKSNDGCAIFPKAGQSECGATDESVSQLSARVLFAVKTCKKYHEDRLPVIQGTWAKSAQKIMYFSEVSDERYKTTHLKGVRNTERGHCHKTMSIIEHFHEMSINEELDWLIIADDDTILSVQKLLQYLHCYDPTENIHLGQRYGYKVSSGNHGYDYITGGGGMIFSKAMVNKIVRSPQCSCGSPDSPDDMHLGMCMSSIGETLVHSPRFHQARPEDYAENYLSNQDPISFHKFWNTDPVKMYNEWFRQADRNLKIFKIKLESLNHNEL